MVRRAATVDCTRGDNSLDCAGTKESGCHLAQHSVCACLYPRCTISSSSRCIDRTRALVPSATDFLRAFPLRSISKSVDSIPLLTLPAMYNCRGGFPLCAPQKVQLFIKGLLSVACKSALIFLSGEKRGREVREERRGETASPDASQLHRANEHKCHCQTEMKKKCVTVANRAGVRGQQDMFANEEVNAQPRERERGGRVAPVTNEAKNLNNFASKTQPPQQTVNMTLTTRQPGG